MDAPQLNLRMTTSRWHSIQVQIKRLQAVSSLPTPINKPVLKVL